MFALCDTKIDFLRYHYPIRSGFHIFTDQYVLAFTGNNVPVRFKNPIGTLFTLGGLLESEELYEYTDNIMRIYSIFLFEMKYTKSIKIDNTELRFDPDGKTFFVYQELKIPCLIKVINVSSDVSLYFWKPIQIGSVYRLGRFLHQKRCGIIPIAKIITRMNDAINDI